METFVKIPHSIMKNKNLTAASKILYCYISDLNANGECFASNNWFAEEVGISERSVIRLINELVDNNIIERTVTYKKGTKQVEKRLLTLVGSEPKPKEEEPKKTPKKETVPYKEIIDYLNEKAGKDLKHTTKQNQNIIKARFNEGFTLEEFKQVIDNSMAWKGTESEKYIKPTTIFNKKMEQRLEPEFFGYATKKEEEFKINVRF